MQAAGGNQSRRIMKRRNREIHSPDAAPTRYASERVSTSEMRHARLAMLLFGLIFVGACVFYVVATAEHIFQ